MTVHLGSWIASLFAARFPAEAETMRFAQVYAPGMRFGGHPVEVAITDDMTTVT